jgi:Caspase domain
VVVLAFSGHGSQTHQLVTHDADPAALGSTAIALDTLADWFSRIPARRLICFLDCCFSGGLGAKVFLADAVPRSEASTEELLGRLSGKGRVVLTASSATEPAFEHQKLRHGLLTYYLLRRVSGFRALLRGSWWATMSSLADQRRSGLRDGGPRLAIPPVAPVRASLWRGLWSGLRSSDERQQVGTGPIPLAALVQVLEVRVKSTLICRGRGEEGKWRVVGGLEVRQTLERVTRGPADLDEAGACVLNEVGLVTSRLGCTGRAVGVIPSQPVEDEEQAEANDQKEGPPLRPRRCGHDEGRAWQER